MISTRSNSFHVSLPGHEVGQLQRNRNGRMSWSPNGDWEREGQRPRLGIAFLRKPGPRVSGSALPPWFENLLPEVGSALRQRLCSAHGVREGDSFGLLRFIGRDLSGAVEILPHEGESASNEPSRRGIDGEEEEPTEALSDLLRFSLAGMQLKLSMSMANERLVLRASGAQRQWIVKLPGSQYPELPDVERATMTWAKAAGFDVPTHFTVATNKLEGVPDSWRFDVPKAFAIRRFDRRDDGSKIHQEDLCQALELLPVHKYGESGPSRVSLDGALRFVADVAGEASARELSRRVGFVIASGNGDAHLKNWSLRWGNADRPDLTPCYDFVSTVSWHDRHGWGVPEGPSLSLGLGGQRRFSRLDASALTEHARRSGYSWATEETLQGIERARDVWATVEAEMPPLMRTAMSEHWQRVPLLKGMLPAGMAARS